MKYIVLSLLAVAVGCSFKKNPLKNQIQKGHEELYSEPSEPKLDVPDDVQRVVIAATNDVAGQFSAETITFRDDHNKDDQVLQLGGSDALSSYLHVLREQYKDVVLLDSGNIFSAQRRPAEIRQFYSTHKYDAITVGLNDFGLKLPKKTKSTTQYFKDYAAESDVPLVLSNLYELKTARGVEWKGAVPYVLKEVGKAKVGIIGLIPDDIVALTPVDNRVAMFVEDMLTNTLRHARLLRSLGADIIVVMTNQGLRCGNEIAQQTRLPLLKTNFEPMKPNACDLDSPLGRYLQRLPHNLVDVVIGGRTKEKMANYVNDTLVLSGFGHTKSLVYTELFVDLKTRSLLREKSVVHQPVMLCREFFKETKDCFTQDPTVNHKARMSAYFLGRELKFDAVASAENRLPAIDHAQALKDLQADIVYSPRSSGETQLMVLKVKGSDLSKLLELDYNNGSQKDWSPTPYSKKGDFLQLSVQGEKILSEQYYSVLTDIQSVQRSPGLKKYLHQDETLALGTYSWTSFQLQDQVSTKMASQRQ